MTFDELLKIITAVCEAENGLCMDVAWERRRLARAIANAITLHRPNRRAMPNCRHCYHRGADHNWRVPECSLCGRRDPDCANCRHNRERRRVRGACLYYDGSRRCICTKYAPLND